MEWKKNRSLSFVINKNNRHTLLCWVSITIINIIIFFFFFFIFFSFYALFSSTDASFSTASCLDITRCPLISAKADDLRYQDFENSKSNKDMMMNNMEVSRSTARRVLSGPGSSPPRCTSKCGKCTPCKPVHVPVPPGIPVTSEYYPEAWRCKCGNKLYMP